MIPSEYQKLAARTECVQLRSLLRMNTSDIEPPKESKLINDAPGLIPIRLNHAVIGIAGEIGELCELYGGINGTTDQYTLELGDLLWYMALGANATGIHLGDIFGERVDPGEKRGMTAYLRIASIQLGKLASLVQKWIYYGKAYKHAEGQAANELPEELRQLIIDCYRRLAGVVVACALFFGTDVVSIATANIRKLQARYPDKYTDWHAAEENRDRAKEDRVAQDGHGFGHAEPEEDTNVPGGAD